METTSPAISVEISDNIKLGKISMTATSQESCPPTCPLRGNGCYSESGRPNLVTQRLNKSTVTNPLAIAKAEAESIRKLSGRRMLRLHTVGDCYVDEGAKILAEAASEHTAKHGQPVFTYTHGHETARESWGQISVLRSCETFTQVKKAHEDGFASAMVVSEHDSDKAYVHEGFTIIPCPQQTGKAVNCASCKLCTQDKKLHSKKAVIAFAIHGVRAKRVKEILNSIHNPVSQVA
jgi:hypothetical protein